MCQHARNMQRVEISPTTRGWLVAGHVDAATCAAFEHGVGALPDVTGGPIELDMAGVAFIDSSGGESLYGEMFAMSTLSLLPVFFVFLAFQRLIIRGVALGALKR